MVIWAWLIHWHWNWLVLIIHRLIPMVEPLQNLPMEVWLVLLPCNDASEMHEVLLIYFIAVCRYAEPFTVCAILADIAERFRACLVIENSSPCPFPIEKWKTCSFIENENKFLHRKKIIKITTIFHKIQNQNL